MSKTLNILRGSALAIILAMPAFAQDAPSAETVVAIANGEEITLGHMIAVRETLPQQYQSLPNDVLFRGILDQLVQQTLLAQTIESNIPTRAALTLDVQRKAILANEAVAAQLSSAIDEATIQAAYDAKYADFQGSPEFNASHILVASEDEAKAIATEIRAGADFAETAKEKSTGPSGPNGGQLGWFGPGQMVAPFETAVQGLEIGEVSDPVQTQFGWHVIILNDSRMTSAPTLEEVRPELVAQAEDAAAEKIVSGLIGDATVDRSTGDALDPSVITQFDLLDD